MQELIFGNADSHDKGKSVLVFTLNHKKLVFKYKNLEICNAVSEFYKCLEKMDDSFSFYNIRRIVHGTFAIEEFAAYKETENEDALHRYYYRFGQLVMVMYVLGATDLHLENVIAVNDYPVPIDLETVFQNERSIKKDGSAASNLIRELNDGILESSLLPNIYWNRNKKNEIEMSALAGKEQKLPFDVLQLENDSDGIMKMTYRPFIMEGSENLPALQGVKVGYEEYADDIIAGFSDSYHIILNNKSCLTEILEKLFSEKVVRNVLKSTQKYCDILQFSYHPSCMTNYLNREKLMENLWAYPYDNPEAIKFEVQQILDNDIPIFYNNTSSRDLFTKDEKIENYYGAPAMSKILERAERISEHDFVRQRDLLYLALGKYKGEKRTISVTGTENMDIYSQALGIADYIADNAVVGTRRFDITWPSISAAENNAWFLRPMSYSYYDGVVGIYLMYYALEGSTNINKYQNILYRAENMLFSKVPVIHNHEAYIDAVSILYALCCKIKSENNGRDKLFAYKVLKQICDFYRKNKESFTNEWLFGKASLLNLLLTYYEIADRKEAAELACEVAKDISCEKMEGAGFAHGYAGTLYSLLRFIEMNEGYAQELSGKLLWYRQQLKSFGAAIGEDYSWCKGWGGIGLTLLKTYKVYGGGAEDEHKMLAETAEKSLSAELEDDCLCHGDFGLAEFIFYIIEHGMVGEAADKYKNKIKQICLKNQYRIRGMETFPSFDLMTGMAGLAFGYIRGINLAAPKVLLLEV
ncbi:MAG: type 2 lantipeptide synthetase LanM [Lachnospiraceae bacterium]|nr:type 2 lantipeptide synthetase LanM [Lachnospiraceae bacterium]